MFHMWHTDFATPNLRDKSPTTWACNLYNTEMSQSLLKTSYGLYNLRGRRYKLYIARSHLNIGKFFFSQRVVDSWNKLPAHVVEAETVNCFKHRLDNYCSSCGS